MSFRPSSRPVRGAAAEDAALALSPPRRGIPAWVLSGVVHFVVVLSLCVFVRTAPRGAAVEPDREGGIVLVKSPQGKTEYWDEADADAAAAAPNSAVQSAATNSLPSLDTLPIDVAGQLPSPQDLSGMTGDLNAALPDALGLTDGPGPAKVAGGQTQTEIFGVRGVGSKFLYVFDRSGSMSAYEGRPLQAAKAQLIASLRSLTSTDQFQIIFYNERPTIFNPFPAKQPTMMFGTDENKRLATDFIESVTATGGTRHMPALKIALNLQPDVLFFLTDAEEPRLSPDDLSQIQRWNRGTSINSIEFGTRSYSGQTNFLSRLAEQNDGQYAYRNVTKLSVE